MSVVELKASGTSAAEMLAARALSYPAFDGVNLVGLRRKIAELLRLIGRNGIFDTYTRHDMTHIDAMLTSLDWLIPDSTKAIMSPADWMLIVLAVYFHDLGMLVTEAEFKARNSTGFPDFRDSVLFAGEDGQDYRKRIESLDPDEVERFLYQEFVRHRHAERVKNWILGRATEHLGVTHEVLNEVDELLSSLDPQFRNALALICESHHLDDLRDTQKYQVSQPFGNSDEETANLQFAAFVLRAADLLHITSDRTPSIEFRLLSPADPVSQQEWARHQAVKRVRPKRGIDKDGRPSDDAPRDTVEVHAFFSTPEGFFGLTSYLNYAQQELKKVYEWSKHAEDREGVKYEFPWRFIDDQNIETKGFLRDSYSFTIDQQKILDLLTGHTLYNDSSVVLRELAQNAIDAVRLQSVIDSSSKKDPRPGVVKIHWKNKGRTLTVHDNGTGMTQKIIEDHLLKVGSSRYQEKEFKKDFPDFAPISRFGIGILTAFMIADKVEIITCSEEEAEGRYITLRSVHGKYLIRLLDKEASEDLKTVLPHGTLIRLHLRPSAKLDDIEEIARRWIVVPACDVLLQIDEGKELRVGATTVGRALQEELRSMGLTAYLEGEDKGNGETDGTIKIVERQEGGLAVAFGLKYSKFFKEWSFVEFGDRGAERHLSARLGTCVEGIRVEQGTPGFDGFRIAALASFSGQDSPRTNVARSGLEATPQRERLVASLYKVYCEHVSQEIAELAEQGSFSLTWAGQEAAVLVRPLLPDAGRRAISETALVGAIANLPLLLVEKEEKRFSWSAHQLHSGEYFWTSDCALFRAAEWFLRETRGRVSRSALLAALPTRAVVAEREPSLCSTPYGWIGNHLVFGDREIDTIVVSQEERRIDLRWVEISTPPRWATLARIASKVADSDRPRQGPAFRVHAASEEIQLEGCNSLVGVRSREHLFLFAGNRYSELILHGLDRVSKSVTRQEMQFFDWLVELVTGRLRGETVLSDLQRQNLGESLAEQFHMQVEPAEVDLILGVVEAEPGDVFDTYAWHRKEMFQGQM